MQQLLPQEPGFETLSKYQDSPWQKLGFVKQGSMAARETVRDLPLDFEPSEFDLQFDSFIGSLNWTEIQIP